MLLSEAQIIGAVNSGFDDKQNCFTDLIHAFWLSETFLEKNFIAMGQLRVERLFFHSASLSAVFFDELDIVAHKLHSLRRARAESRAGAEGVFHDREVYVHPRFGKELIHML